MSSDSSLYFSISSLVCLIFFLRTSKRLLPCTAVMLHWWFLTLDWWLWWWYGDYQWWPVHWCLLLYWDLPYHSVLCPALIHWQWHNLWSQRDFWHLLSTPGHCHLYNYHNTIWITKDRKTPSFNNSTFTLINLNYRFVTQNLWRDPYKRGMPRWHVYLTHPTLHCTPLYSTAPYHFNVSIKNIIITVLDSFHYHLPCLEKTEDTISMETEKEEVQRSS